MALYPLGVLVSVYKLRTVTEGKCHPCSHGEVAIHAGVTPFGGVATLGSSILTQTIPYPGL